MDIRTKLVFALVAVALGSMLALGGVLYASAGSALRDRRLEQLEGVAESMKDGLEEVSSGWRDRVSLIASRTQLRESLRDYAETGDPEAKAMIRRILGDAVASVDVVESLVVYDMLGAPVASAGWSVETDIPEHLPLPVRTSGGIQYQGASVMGDGHLRVAYAAPLVLEGDPEGVLQVRLNATSLLDMTESRARLGATGEVLIVFRGPDQKVWVLHRIRPSEDRIWEEIPPGKPATPCSWL